MTVGRDTRLGVSPEACYTVKETLLGVFFASDDLEVMRLGKKENASDLIVTRVLPVVLHIM